MPSLPSDFQALLPRKECGSWWLQGQLLGARRAVAKLKLPWLSEALLMASDAERIEAQRNFRRQPIGRIPVEIFGLIFAHLSREWDNWTTIIHVCRYWRKVALDDLALWENVSLPVSNLFFLVAEKHPTGIRHFFVTANLTKTPSSLSTDAWKLEALGPRIQSFDVVATDDTFWQVWWTLHRKAADYLHLELRPSMDGVWKYSGAPVGLMKPEVKRLSITHCPLAWCMIGEASGLQEPVLNKATAGSRPPRPTISTIATALHKQRLSRLVVNCPLDFEPIPAISLKEVSFELEELVMPQDIWECWYFLQYIQLPPTTKVDLSGATHRAFKMTTNKAGCREVAGYYRGIANRLGGKGQDPIWSIEVRHEEHAIHVKAYIKDHSAPTEPVGALRCRIYFSIPVTATPTTSAAVTRACLEGIWDGLSLRSVGNVTITGRTIHEKYTGGYSQLLNRLPSTEIVIDAQCARSHW